MTHSNSRRILGTAAFLSLAVVGQSVRAQSLFDASTRRLSFQAVLRDNVGTPLPGPTVDLAFRIYTSGGGLVEGPINMPAVPIVNGVVDLQFPILTASFNGTARLLGVSVNGGAELAPRIPLVSVPHALRVDRVASAELDDSIDLGSASAAGVLNLYRTAANTPGITLTGSTSQISTFGSDGLEQVRVSGTTFGEILLNDNVGNNTTVVLSATNETGGLLSLRDPSGAVRASLQAPASGANFVLYDGAASPSISLRGDLGGRIDVEGSLRVVTVLAGLDLALVEKDANGGLFETHDETGLLNVRIGSQSTAGIVEVYQSNGTTIGVRVDGDSSVNGGGLITVYEADGQAGMTVDGDSGGAGRLSLFNTAGSTRVVLDGDDVNSNGGGLMYLYQADGNLGIEALGNGNGGDGAGYMSLRNIAGTAKITLDGDNAGSAVLTLFQADANTSIILDSDFSGAGYLAIRQGNGTTNGVYIASNATSGGFEYLYQADGGIGVYLDGDGGTNAGGIITVYQADGQAGMTVDGDSGGAGRIQVFNAAGTASITIDGDVSGDGRITTQELVLTGGSDLSEQFDINAPGSAKTELGKGDREEKNTIVPGMVVCINPKQAGNLCVADKPYDRTVAGVISGAGGVKPGMMMGQKGTLADGKHPVALTGRVYCWVDADLGSVEPGDLLTSSATTGHAMKVTDHARAQGAIVGKAMTGLSKGRGLVLVLVTLQ